MSIAVSDSGPIHYLVLVGAVDVLHLLFDRVYAPMAVYSELTHHSTPESVKIWVSSPPEWLEIRAVRSLVPPEGIDLGEQEAIGLAEEIAADVVLIDDRKARQAAQQRGLAVTGTIGLLTLAARRGHLDLHEAFEHLKQTNLHISPIFLDAVLKKEQGLG